MEWSTTVAECEDKWWITKRHEIDDSKFGFVCQIHSENIYDGSEIEITHFKKLSNAYNYVCEYITNMCRSFSSEDLDLEEDSSDWQNFNFRLNYGSSSGATLYSITVSRIKFKG